MVILQVFLGGTYRVASYSDFGVGASGGGGGNIIWLYCIQSLEMAARGGVSKPEIDPALCTFTGTANSKKDPSQKSSQVDLMGRLHQILETESGFHFIQTAKTETLRLINEMPSPPNVPGRQARTNNNFSVFIGRLNPPHKFHLISLLTAILMARINGTKALLLLGSGKGPNPKNPLTFTLKSDFIVETLLRFGFIRSTDYDIQEQHTHVSQIRDFIGREYDPRYQGVQLFHIGGDKSERRGKMTVLDVDNLPMPVNFTTPADVIIGINGVKVVIPSMTEAGGSVMSASLVRQTACDFIEQTPDSDHSTAFRLWQERFAPMYDGDVSSSLARRVFDAIIRQHCQSLSKGGSRRKRTRKPLNKKTLRRTRTRYRTRYTRRLRPLR